MGEFGGGFGGGDLNGNGHFYAGDYEMWRDIEHGGHSCGGSSGEAYTQLIAWTLIIVGVLLAAIFPPFGLLIWLGAKLGS